jgi:hypothetical protein
MGNRQSKIYNQITGSRYPIKLLDCDSHLIPPIITQIYLKVNNDGLHFYQNDYRSKVFFHIEWNQVSSWHIEKNYLTIFLNNSFETSISISSLYANIIYNNCSKITQNLAHNIIDYPN